MATAVQKFLFDVSFDAPDLPEPGVVRKPPPEPTFTRAELEAARADGAVAGRAAALAEAAHATEAALAAALETIEHGVAVLLGKQAEHARTAEQQAIAVLRTVLAKAVPALCRTEPLAEIEALVARCLAEALDEPRVVLRVAEPLFEALQPRLAGIAKATGYGGKIVLLADPGLTSGDARVEWADGGAERDTRRLAAEVDQILTRMLTAAPLAAGPIEEKPHG